MARVNAKTCYECNAPLKRPGAFCTPAHKAAYHNRRAKRGALLLDVHDNLRKLATAGKHTEAAQLDIRLGLLWRKWEAEDKAAARRSMSRSLTDVLYDDELPREYEEGRYEVTA